MYQNKYKPPIRYLNFFKNIDAPDNKCFRAAGILFSLNGREAALVRL